MDEKSLSDMLDSVKGDRCLENLVFRYYQGLELWDSHWPESMLYDRLLPDTNSETIYQDKRPKSKRQIEEEILLKDNPNADANLLWLQRKYTNTR